MRISQQKRSQRGRNRKVGAVNENVIQHVLTDSFCTKQENYIRLCQGKWEIDEEQTK